VDSINVTEIPLENLDVYYTEQLNIYYAKQKKALKKFVERLEKFIIDLKSAIDKMRARKDSIELDEQAIRYVERFYSKVKENLDVIQVPNNPTAEGVYNLIDEIKKLFINMNELGRKNIPRFAKEFELELKEIDFITRKISEQYMRIDVFIRKKYSATKDAEALSKQFPKLENVVERIINTKSTVDNFNHDLAILENELVELEQGIIDIENNPLFVKQSELEKKLFDLRIDFDNKLKFRKALKKLKKKVDPGTFRGITPEMVKKYISDPYTTIVNEGETHPQLTEFLIQVRYMLEQGGLNLKTDAKNKLLQNIEQIVSHGVLHPIIAHYQTVRDELNEINNNPEQQTLNDRLNELKELYSIKTQELDHLKADANHKSTEYRHLLEKLKNDRDEIHQKIKEYIDQDVTVKISLKF
jgi:predicted  nucleic acid-binding Zn-ribbon protein